jgi:OOP family OmpA-OmpF porin
MDRIHASMFELSCSGPSSRRLASIALAALVAACGSSTQFNDRTPIVIAGRVPAAQVVQLEPPRVELREDRIVINEKIQFAYNDDRILEQSFSLLDEVASVIQKNPQIKSIEIGGHASTEGGDDHNLRLSDRRAKAVMKRLVANGVDAARLTSKGYGEIKPLVHPDDTEEQREINRRVEFLILDQEVTQRQVQIDPTTGEETPLGATPQPANADEGGQ